MHSLDSKHELVGQNSQIAQGVAEVLIHRLQTAGFELQRALLLIDCAEARSRISLAADNLNEAIKVIYLTAVDLSSPESE